MPRRHPTPLEELVEPGVRVPHIEPLQTRVAKNRWKLVSFLTIYITSMAAAAALTVGLATILLTGLSLRYGPLPFMQLHEVGDFIWAVTRGSFFASLALALVWSLIRIQLSELTLLRKLGAVIAASGTCMPTKKVLHDVAIAAGMRAAPSLYVIDTNRVNAFVLSRSSKTVRIGVTRGLMERISPDEQRAVFANLLARALSRDTLWATAVSALVGPLAAYREYGFRADMPDFGENHTTPAPNPSGINQSGAGALVAFLMVSAVAVILTEILSWYSREAVWRMAEKADAEGMLLLKDPRSMLRAVEHVLDRDNHVPSAGDAYSPLFYCWAGFGFAPEDDPERRRVARLREALGAEGAAYVPRPNVPDWSNPPVAPRVEQLREIEGHPPGGIGKAV